MGEINEVTGKHQLRVVFDGVVAVGPPHPEEGVQEQEGPFFGVMARSTRRLSDRSRRLGENPPKYIPMHVPTIYTTMKPVDGSRPPDEVFQLSSSDPKWYIWHPLRERLEFRFDGDGTPGTLTYDDPRVIGQETGPLGRNVKMHSIEKVPDAREIWPERCYLLDGLLTAATPMREEAQAQILLPWGKVAGGGIFDKENGVEVVFEPARGAEGPRTVVPNVVVSVDVEQVEIAAYSLDGAGEKLDSLKFLLTEDAELWISNGDPSDTAIDLKKLSDQIRQTPGRELEFDEELVHGHFFDAFHEIVGAGVDLHDLQRFALHLTGGGGMFRPNVVDNQFVRSSDVDIDFELFYTLMEGRDDGCGLPVPRKSDGKNFQGPNCLCKLVQCRERLHLKSND